MVLEPSPFYTPTYPTPANFHPVSQSRPQSRSHVVEPPQSQPYHPDIQLHPEFYPPVPSELPRYQYRDMPDQMSMSMPIDVTRLQGWADDPSFFPPYPSSYDDSTSSSSTTSSPKYAPLSAAPSPYTADASPLLNGDSPNLSFGSISISSGLNLESSALGPNDLTKSSFIGRMATPAARQRTAQACDKCRQRKTKCSGDKPVCARCTGRGLICKYTEEADMKKRKVRGPAKATGYTMAVIMSPGRTRPPKKHKDTSRFHPAVNSSSKFGSHGHSRHASPASAAFHTLPRPTPLAHSDTLTPLPPKNSTTPNPSNMQTSISQPTHMNADHYSNTHYYSDSLPNPRHSVPHPYDKAPTLDQQNGPPHPRVQHMRTQEWSGRRASYPYGLEMEHPQPTPVSFSSPVPYQGNHRHIHHPKRAHSWSAFPSIPYASTHALPHSHQHNELLDGRFHNTHPSTPDQPPDVHTPRASNHMDDPHLSFMYLDAQPHLHANDSHNHYQYGDQWNGELIGQHNFYDGGAHGPQISATGIVNLDAFTFPPNPSSNLPLMLPDHSNATIFHPTPTPTYTYGYPPDAPPRSESMSSMSSAATSNELPSPVEGAIPFDPEIHTMLQESGELYNATLLPQAFEGVGPGFSDSQQSMITVDSDVNEKQHGNMDEEMMEMDMDADTDIAEEDSMSEDRGYTDPEQYVLKHRTADMSSPFDPSPMDVTPKMDTEPLAVSV